MFFAGRLTKGTRDAYTRDTMSGLFGAMMMGSTMPFLAVIARDQLKATELQMAVLSVSPVAGNLLMLFWANIMEGRRKMPFAFWAWVLSRSLFFLILFTRTAPSFIAVICLFWIIASISGPPYTAIMKEIYPDGERAMAMAYARICTLCVMSAISFASGFLLKSVSFHYVFPVAALFGIASAYMFNSIPTKQTTGDPSIKIGPFLLDSVQILVEDKGFRWFCAGIFVSGFANLMLGPVIAIYQVDILHVRTQWAGIYAVLAQASQMIGYAYWGRYIDRKSSVEVVAITGLLLCLMPIGYCLSTQAWMLLPVMILLGFVIAGADLSYFNGVLHYAPHERITQYQAVFACLMGIRGLMAPFLAAYLVKNHFFGAVSSPLISMKILFIIAAAMMIISYFIQMVGVRKYDKPISS